MSDVTAARQKAIALDIEQREFQDYLDKRIPELHAIGKVDVSDAPNGAVAALRQSQVLRPYPGRVARDVAVGEYVEGARA